MTASQYATKLGLDIDRFKNDLDSERLKQLIEADKAEGEKWACGARPLSLSTGSSTLELCPSII